MVMTYRMVLKMIFMRAITVQLMMILVTQQVVTYYYYYDIDRSYANGLETMLGLSYKDFGLTAQTLLEDVSWGNAGDTYIKASYSYALPKDFSLDTALGLYAYQDSGDFEDNLGTTESFWFPSL